MTKTGKIWNFIRPKTNTNQAKQTSSECSTAKHVSERPAIMEQLKLSNESQSNCSEAGANRCLAGGDCAAVTASVSCENNKVESILYYAVSLPLEAHGPESAGTRPLYFTEKQEVLQEVKKHKGARFKTFRSKDEAIAFSLQPAEQTCPTPRGNSLFGSPSTELEKNTTLNGEKPSPFKGPKSQDMVKLRKAIEAGNAEYFNETVWSNPRYLISSGDTPAILQEGFRYNGLHVAAKHKQAEMCELILKTIQDPKFMELLYSDDAFETRMQRISYVTDLYLNMPDKGLCESPLHFACKFGCLQAVRVLASHHLCDKEHKNKYGLKPKKIICERCPSSSSEVKGIIEEALEGQYFVPVLRAEDNSVQPFVGMPYSQVKDNSAVGEMQDRSPCKAKLSIMAVAGPLSPKDANQLYRKWKTPPSHFSWLRYQHLNKIRLSDTEKGLEIVGRHLARNYNTPWSEYWPSLNAWLDISSKEGLQTLENHLKKHYYIMSSKRPSPIEESPESIGTDENFASPSLREASSTANFTHSTPTVTSPNSSSSSGGMSSLCSGFMSLNIGGPENLCTSPDMPSMFLKHNNNFAGSDDNVSNESISSLSLRAGCKDGNSELVANDIKNFNTPRRSIRHLKKLPFLQSEDCEKVESNSCDTIPQGKPNFSKKWAVKDFKTEERALKNSQRSYECILENNLPHSFIPPIRVIVENIFHVFSNIISDSPNAENTGMRMHLLLAEDVLSKIDLLLHLSCSNEKNLSGLHSIVSFAILKEVQNSLLHHETKLLFRYINSYLDKYSSANLSDEEEDIMDQKYSRNHNSCNNKLKWQHLRCILKFLSTCKSVSSDTNLIQSPCECLWLSQNNQQNIHNTFSKLNLENQSDEDSDSNSSDSSDDSDSEDFVTPPCSPSAMILTSDDEDQPVTPDEGVEVYIEGEWPSKADTDILRAIEDVSLDPVSYPHICRWKHLISLKDEVTVQSWPSPAAKKFKERSLSRISETPSTQYSPENPLSTSNSISRNRLGNNISGIREASRQLFDQSVTQE